MTHTRYWAASFAVAILAGFMVIVRFAFDSSSTPWIVLGVAIGATALSLGGFLLAMQRDSQTFSGLSALSAVIGTWTIIAMLTLNDPTAGWVAFADGLALLIVSLQVLALHETSIERVVHVLGGDLSAEPVSARTSLEPSTPATPETSSRMQMQISPAMRSWTSWLANTVMALAGAFVVLLTFALTQPGTNHVSPRWIVFGISVAVAVMALGSLIERGGHYRAGRTSDWTAKGRLGMPAVAAGTLVASVLLIIAMVVYAGNTARWIAFSLGCVIAGVSLVGLAIHEITTERVRHELEVAEPIAHPSSSSKEAGVL